MAARITVPPHEYPKYPIAGLDGLVKQHNEEASILWHNISKQCGAPSSAVVADVMRRF